MHWLTRGRPACRSRGATIQGRGVRWHRSTCGLAESPCWVWAPIVIAGIAALLAWRDRLVLALALGTGALLLAALALRYEPAPWDLGRLVGHARNFALLALVLALSARLADLRPPRWRYAAGALLAVLVIWADGR